MISPAIATIRTHAVGRGAGDLCALVTHCLRALDDSLELRLKADRVQSRCQRRA